MPPKPDISTGKTHDEVVVLTLVMMLKENGHSLGKAAYETMHKLHGERSVDSFNHSLRAINKLAGELVEKKKNGVELSPADVGRTSGGDGGAAANTPKKRKSASGGEDGGAAKKKRAPAKKGGKKADTPVGGRSFQFIVLLLIMLRRTQRTTKSPATLRRSRARMSLLELF